LANNFANMQEEALRRAREMYSRGRSANQTAQNQSVKPPPINTSAEGKKDIKSVNQSKNIPPHTAAKNRDMLEFLLKDPDKTIILALLILLSGEKTDSSLIFALMYLLM